MFDFQMLPSWFIKNKVASSMVGKTWSHVHIVVFLACQTVGIVGSQIETERIFLIGIHTNLRTCAKWT
jgi:hypothetical protein